MIELAASAAPAAPSGLLAAMQPAMQPATGENPANPGGFAALLAPQVGTAPADPAIVIPDPATLAALPAPGKVLPAPANPGQSLRPGFDKALLSKIEGLSLSGPGESVPPPTPLSLSLSKPKPALPAALVLPGNTLAAPGLTRPAAPSRKADHAHASRDPIPTTEPADPLTALLAAAALPGDAPAVPALSAAPAELLAAPLPPTALAQPAAPDALTNPAAPRAAPRAARTQPVLPPLIEAQLRGHPLTAPAAAAAVLAHPLEVAAAPVDLPSAAAKVRDAGGEEPAGPAVQLRPIAAELPGRPIPARSGKLATPAQPAITAALTAPTFASIQPGDPAAMSAPVTAATASTPGYDFGALVDRLVSARDAARSTGLAQQVGIVLDHAEFGPVSLRFQHDDGGLTVAASAANPAFARAAEAALPAAAAAQQSASGDTAGQRHQPATRGDGNTAGNPPQGQSAGAGQGGQQGNNQPHAPRGEARGWLNNSRKSELREAAAAAVPAGRGVLA